MAWRVHILSLRCESLLPRISTFNESCHLQEGEKDEKRYDENRKNNPDAEVLVIP